MAYDALKPNASESKTDLLASIRANFAALLDGSQPSTQLNVDNMRIDGNTLSSTDTDGDINITPDGAGEVNITTATNVDKIVVGGASSGANDDVESDVENGIASNIKANHASFTGRVSNLETTRAANSAFSFLVCNSDVDSSVDREFNLLGDGNGQLDGSWSSPAADYAEYFESVDGTRIPVGTSVILDGGKVRPALATEDPDGVISATPTVVGNSADLKWNKKFLRTEYGNYDLDENGDRKLNPDYSPEVVYIPRAQRPEWNIVGLLGQVAVTAGQPIGERWKFVRAVSERVNIYLVR